MTVNSESGPVVYGKGVHTNSSVHCKQRIHKHYNRVCGLSLVVDGFRCKRCDGTIQEADLHEDLVVDGETWMCSFCYLGDALGGEDLVATARIIIRNE